jgi:hypothetical protein
LFGYASVTLAGDRCAYIQVRLREAETAGLLKRIIAGLNPERLRRELHLWNSQLEAAQKQEALASLGQVSAASSLNEAQQRLAAVKRALAQTSNLPPAAEVAKRLENSAARVKSLVSELAAINQKISEIELAVLAEARIVGATLSKLSTTPDLYRNLFDDVIVDEVSMTPQPHLWLASSVANKRVICLGDFRQLGPIFTADSEMAKERLGKDIFTQAGIVDSSDQVSPDDPRLASLSIQYRMHPIIGELVNALIYRDDGNELAHLADPAILKRGLEAQPNPGIPIVLYDTSAANPWCARMEPGFSRYNIYSALVTIRVAEQASRQSPDMTIGVVTPYAVQTRLLKILATEHGLRDSVKVATVHRFQGNEMDMMVFDLVDGPPFPIGTLLRGSQGRRLLNVAFSRAKGKLVVVANQAFLATKSAVDDPLGKALLYFRENAQWVNSQTLLRGYGDDELLEVDRKLRGTLHVGNPEGMTFYDESAFYDAFVQDLLTAKEQVIVFSPFIRPGRAAQVVSTFRALIARGVEVHVLTRGGGRRQATEEDVMIATLQGVSVKVSTRKGLHEKLAFIDDEIAWE